MILFGTSMAIVAAIFYQTYFNYDLNESMYMAQNWLLMKKVATHNLVIKIFEFIYERDYMLDKLEELSVAGLLSVIINTCIYAPLAIQEKVFGGGKKR